MSGLHHGPSLGLLSPLEGTQKEGRGKRKEKKRAGFPRTPESQAEGITFRPGGVTWPRRRRWPAAAGADRVAAALSVYPAGIAYCRPHFTRISPT